MAIQTSYEGSNDDFENSGTTGYTAQGFKVPSNCSCNSISISGSRGSGSSGTFAMEIYSGAAPDSTLVQTETFNSTVLSAYDANPHWDEVVFTTPVNLVAGTQYYARFRSVTGSATDELRWSTDTTSPSYADGTSWVFTAAVWTQQSTRCKNFRVNGTVSNSSSGFLAFF